MLSTDAGKVMRVMPVPLKALLPMVFSVSGMAISVTED